jgi:hypothetical protein
MKTRTPAVPGPRACWRTLNVIAPCDVCGAHPVVVHVPLHERGFRCPEHCPHCRPAAGAAVNELSEGECA